MDRQPVAVGDPEQPDEIDRIVLEDRRPRDRDAAALDARNRRRRCGLRAGRNRPTKRSSIGMRLGLALFQGGADDRGEIADILGDEEIMLHEAFDAGEAAARRIAELRRDLALDGRRSAAPRPAGHEMEMAAHPPEKFLAAAKQPVFGA